MAPIITLTTDFGNTDPYVGLMKGVILSIAPDVQIVDLCHGLPPQDITAGALTVESAVGCFSAGCIHLVVVDPGVGTARDAVAVRGKHHRYVGPDNGVFLLAMARDPVVEAVRLDNPEFHRQPVSSTFHGRDIFAPAAAHLAAGRALEDLGSPINRFISLDLPQPVEDGSDLLLHVVRVDHFGNLITDLDTSLYQQWLRAGGAVVLIGKSIVVPVGQTYAEVALGSPVAYFGSSGRLEIGVRNGSAEAAFGLKIGGQLRLSPRR